jgi:twitching motility protein PilT
MEVAKNLDDLLREAVSMGGSDLHLSVGAQPRTRVHGNLKNMNYAVITPQVASNLLMPLMDTLARSTLNTCGQYDLAYSIKDVSRFRVNIFKQKGDLAGVFRVLNETVPDYTKLGLPINVFNMYKKRRGLILVVGPTGSGKSTTLASFLDIINKNLYKHIITLEEPIEYLHWHSRSLINQREIGVDCDSFANGLRAALREDSDVILIGEMRDLETTEIALQSAETGHLVCSTLHTLGAADTINRIIDMYPEKQHNQVRSQLCAILEAVVSQQLMPKADGSGYVVTYEVMFKNKTIQKMIRDKKIDEISDYLNSDEAKSQGMVSMDTTIMNLYKKGLVTKDTALDYAFDRREMAKKMGK